jgi:hypothetical protein
MAAATTTIAVAGSVDELLAGTTERAPMKTVDSLSGSRFERVVIGGRSHVVKYLCVDDDWIMRGTGDRDCRQRRLWASPLVARIPEVIDHAVVGMAGYTNDRGHDGLALLMRDVSDLMVPEGSSLLPDERHLRFLDHMAALHAAFWGWSDDLGLMPLVSAYTVLTPVTAALEAARGTEDAVPAAVGRGWARFPAAAPRAGDLVLGLLADPGPLVEGLARTPGTLIQADWKLGNLGSHADGRTVLLDWDRTGEGPACFELAWYLAVNCDRMALSKEAAIAAYRTALEARGIRTEPWWEQQLGLALLGALLMLGWAKVDGGAELAWWEERALAAAEHLG